MRAHRRRRPPALLAPEIDLALLVPIRSAEAIGTELGTRGFCVHAQDERSRIALAEPLLRPARRRAEDIATGSTQASLPPGCGSSGASASTCPVLRFVAEQGDALGRPCRLRVEMTTDDGALVKVRVGGQVVTVSERPVAPGEL